MASADGWARCSWTTTCGGGERCLPAAFARQDLLCGAIGIASRVRCGFDRDMTYGQYNTFCGSLPATSYVCQWGGSHVWKVGGKVFAIGGWERGYHPAVTFKVSEIGWEVLRDAPGCRPAPYLASRGMKWIQAYDKPGLKDSELRQYLKQSHAIVAAGLSLKKRRELGLLD
jgi:predicted DNA-binding protein (MmcQ/YjbR family)